MSGDTLEEKTKGRERRGAASWEGPRKKEYEGEGNLVKGRGKGLLLRSFACEW